MLSVRRRRTTVPQVVTLIAGSKRRSLLIAGDDEEMFMTKSFNVTPKATEKHLIVRSDKSVAYVTNSKRLRWTYCTIETNYWQTVTRSIARPLCNSRATCYVSLRCYVSWGLNKVRSRIQITDSRFFFWNFIHSVPANATTPPTHVAACSAGIIKVPHLVIQPYMTPTTPNARPLGRLDYQSRFISAKQYYCHWSSRLRRI